MSRYVLASILILSILLTPAAQILFAPPAPVQAQSTHAITSTLDFQGGYYNNTEATTQEGELKLKGAGTWNTRVWRTPFLTLTDGTSFTTDGTYTYMLIGRDTRFVKYLPNEDRWKELASAPFMPTSGADMVVLGDYIYATFGGYQKSFARYSMSSNTWSTLTSLPDLIYSGSSIQTDGTDIYVMRGQATTDFWKYTVSTGTWSTLTAPPATISTGGDMIYDDSTGTAYLYTPRGSNTTTFYRYGIAANTWTTMAVAPGTLNDNGNMTKVGDYIYTLRGSNTTTFYRYRISTDTWSTLTTTPAAARYVGLSYNADEDLIYVFRGNSSYDWWKYDPDTDTFLGLTDLPATPGTGADIVFDGTDIFYRRGSNTTTFYQYDISADTWNAKSAMPATSNDDTKGVKAGNYLYYTRGGNTTSFYRYSPSGDSWSTMSNTPAAARFGSSLAYPGSGNYIYGTRGASTTSFWRYSISGDSWDDAGAADLPAGAESSYGSRLVSDGTDVYSITGNGISKLMKYSVSGNSWSELGSTPFPPYYGTDLVFYNGKIYAQAGYYKRDVWEYTIATDTWRRLGDMAGYYAQDVGPYNGGSLAADTTTGTLYAINGQAISRLMTYSVSSNNYPATGTWTSDTIDLTYVSSWDSLSASTTTPGDSSITYESRSSADKTTWTSWETVSSGTIASTAQRYIQVRATLSATSDYTQTPVIASISIAYNGDTTAPTNPSAFTGTSQAVGGTSITSGASYAYNQPYFTWSGATDADTSVAGYYVYFGTTSGADPETAGNYQTAATYTVTTPMSTGTYYLRVKTKDTSGNVSTATTGFTYVYNGVSPPQSDTATTTADFSTGTASSVDTSSDQIRLSGKSGFWQQSRLTTVPAGVNYGASFAYVSSSNKLYTFRGVNTTTFYEYDIDSDTWTTLAAAPAVVYQGGDIVEGPAGYLFATPGKNASTFWRYDIAADTWSDAAASDAPLAFYYGTSFIYDGSQYIYALRGNSDDAFMRYDTSTDSWDTLTNADFGAPTDRYDNNVYVGGDMAYDGDDTLYAIQGNTRTGFSSYSISGDSWTVLTDLPALPYDGAQIVYDDTSSAVYFIPGWSNPFLYKYDIGTQTWSALQNAPAAISAGGTMRNVDGTLYILRGGSQTTFWTYNIAKASWQIPNVGLFGAEFRGTDYLTFGYGANIVKGDGNYMYLVRGNFDNVFVRYDTTSGEVTDMADAPAGFNVGTSMAYDSTTNKIYATPSQYQSDLMVYDIATNTWSIDTADNLPAGPGPGSSMTYDGNRYIYWARGGTTSFYRYDTQGSSGAKWTQMSNVAGSLSYGAELIYDNGYIYTPRGSNQLSFYRYDVAGDSWSDAAVADLPSGATVYNDGFSVLNGNYIYTCRGGNTTGCYQYSISGDSWAAMTDAPANIYTGGAAASNGSDKIFVIAGAGTSTFNNGLYSYVMQTSGSSVEESGTFSSGTHDLTSVYKFANISVGYTSANNTTLTVYTRSSSDDSTYSSWSEASEQKVVGSTYEYKISSTAARYLQVKFELTSSDGIYSGTISDYTINWYQDADAPTNPTTLLGYDTSSLGVGLTTSNWYNYSTPYFDWPEAEATGGATDTSTGAGVSGYYVYFGTDSAADPEVSGTLSSNTYFQAPTLTSGSTYYLRIKTVDAASNVASTAWQPFIYKYDATVPTNATTIVANPPGYTATNSFVFTWSGAADTDSGVASYCYKTGEDGSTDTCTTETSVSTVTAYKTGTNTFYVRTKDSAGNYSSDYASASYYYSSTAPGAPQDLAVDPATNTDNEFAFTWSPPATYYGSQSGLRYYYSVNAFPTSSNVNSVGLEVTYLSAGAYATQKDNNTMYVVAKDEAGNIDYNNYASVDFTADTSAPGIPQSMEIADVSVKETSSWKLAVSWEPPESAGSGIANYKIYSSTTEGASCSSSLDDFTAISTTTGKSFVDTDLDQITHYYCVKACTSTNDCSAVSDTVSFYPDGRWKVAASLTSEPVVTVKTRTATINWSTGREANSFVKYGKSSGSYGTETGSSEAVTAHEIDLDGLDPGTTYYYKVLWTDEDGNVGESDEDSFTTEEAPVVSSVTLQNISLSTAYVTFTVKNATQATVQYGKTEAYGGVETVSTSKSEASYTVQLRELTDGTLYHLRIVGEDDEGNTYAGDDYTFQTLPVPKIIALRIQQVEGMPTATFRLLWTSNTRLTSIVTYYPVGKAAESKEFINLTPKTSHQALIQNLADESDYVFTIKGKDLAGNEAVYEAKNVKTAQDLRAPEVSNINVETTIVGVGQDARAQTIISWDTDEPATSQIEYGEGASGAYTSSTQEDPILSFNHSVTIPGLTPSKIYHFRILSADKNKNKGVSIDTVVITPNATKDALNLVVANLSKTFGFLKKTKLK